MITFHKYQKYVTNTKNTCHNTNPSQIVSVIKSVWKPGIAQIKNDYDQEVCIIKLNGSPFWFSFSNEFALQVLQTLSLVQFTDTDEPWHNIWLFNNLSTNSNKVHYTILKLMDRLDKKGYQLILATDVARYFELSTLFFTEKPPKGMFTRFLE